MDYEAFISAAREHVPAAVGIDMCRHESVKHPTFWLFHDNSQIGSAAYEPNNALPWRATKLRNGCGYAERRFIAMDQALRFAYSN